MSPLDTWRSLSESLIEDAAAVAPADVAGVTRLRRSHDAASVGAALELTAARRKAVAKFPDRAATLWADVPGVEQASSRAVADHKAARFIDCGFANDRIVDLCCGIGGDAMSLPHAVGIDADPLRAWMCRRNTGNPALAADVTTLPLRDRVFHLDPARRNKRGRVWRLDDYQPGPNFITNLLRDNPTGAIKLGPGVDREALPWPGELEWISERGRLVQAVLWTANLARHDHTATLIADTKYTVHGQPNTPDLAPMQRYIFTVDPALERARLMHTIGLPAVHPKLGLLTSNAPQANPWLTGFEVLVDRLPPRKVKTWLHAHDGGIVEVKTRDKAADPDRLQQDWRGHGDTIHTVFVLRWDDRVYATITRRLSSGS